MSLIKPVLGRGFTRSIKGITHKFMPVIAGHKLLYRCNLECKMCPFWRREDEALLSLEDEVRMLESLKKAGVLFMGFEGGEPLLRPDIDQILEESYSRFHTSMVSNGWLLRKKIGEIKDNIDFLFVSLDGIGSVHDRPRGVTGSYDRALEGIKEASKYVNMAISSTLTAENLEQANDLIKLATKLGVQINFQIAFDYSTAEKESPNANQLKNAIENLLIMKRNKAPIMNTKEYFDSILNSWYHGISWECKPWLTINIDPTGKIVMPCYVLNEYSGSYTVWDTDILKLWGEYPWGGYTSCNKCALACYLEPSLFSWSKPSQVKSRIIDNIASYIHRQIA
jgi:radical SAM family uncharacterized protein